jgi:hypothetical protein
MHVGVGHSCGGHGLSDVGWVLLGCALLISYYLSIYELAELTSAWSEMNAASQIPHIFVRDVFRE